MPVCLTLSAVMIPASDFAADERDFDDAVTLFLPGDEPFFAPAFSPLRAGRLPT